LTVSGEPLVIESGASWRSWLENHHASEKEAFPVFFKKHVHEPCLRYEEAVVEALCFGWIDGILSNIDRQRYLLRFCLRRPGSVWARSNKRKALRLIREGRMTEAGIKLVEAAKLSGKWGEADADRTRPPDDLISALEEVPGAEEGFLRFSPSHRAQRIYHLESGKRPETRSRRIQQAVRASLENRAEER
jgi:uncharacterized protein YdeI (YjbR/CyaY-like superfamily)